MFQKIKELMQIKELIDEISAKTKGYSETVTALKTDLNSLKAEISSLKNSQSELLTSLRADLSEIHSAKDELKKELYEFNLLKAQLQKKIIEKFEAELAKELKLNLEHLKSDSKEYEELKKELTQIAKRTTEISTLLNNISEIGKNIKKEDFELTRYAREIFNADHEKLELMKKIDNLERLISQMRRNQPQTAQRKY